MSNCKEAFNFSHLGCLHFWKILFFKITGGRPMIDLGHYFTDTVTGESVRKYQDRLGRHWMATGAWSLFRCEIEKRRGAEH